MTTLQRLRELIAGHFDMSPDALEASTTIESLGADSYDRLEMQQIILETFAIEIPERITLAELTIGDIARIIDSALEAAA